MDTLYVHNTVYLPNEVIIRILEYISPSDLYRIILDNSYLGVIIKQMNREKYFIRWHSEKHLNRYSLSPDKKIDPIHVSNNWFMKLRFNLFTYDEYISSTNCNTDDWLFVKFSNYYTDYDHFKSKKTIPNIPVNIYGFEQYDYPKILLPNITHLRNLHRIMIYNSSVTDIQILHNIHTVILNSCRYINDVTALADSHTVDLTNCYNITNVSALGNVHTLKLCNCQNITDVSMLGNVHTLNLYNCIGVSDVSALGNVHILNLSGCHNITNVSTLGNVHTLNLNGCGQLTGIDALSNVNTLYIGYKKITNK